MENNKIKIDKLSLQQLNDLCGQLIEKRNRICEGVAYECSWCKAKPGDKCKTLIGNISHIHQVRLKLAVESNEYKNVQSDISNVMSQIELIKQKIKDDELLEKINKQIRDLSNNVFTDTEQHILVERTNNRLEVIKTQNMVVPAEHIIIYESTLNHLICSGVKITIIDSKVNHQYPHNYNC